MSGTGVVDETVPAPFRGLPAAFREALALHDVMHTFGVPTEQIFVAVQDGLFFMIAKDGAKQFAVGLGRFEHDEAEFRRTWDRAVAAYNTAPTEARKELLNLSHARDQAAQIITGLVLQGFSPRGL